MPLYLKKGLQLLFIHIPKCGGTTVEVYLRDCGWREEYFIGNIYKSGLTSIRVSPQHMHASILEDLFDEHNLDFSVALVRHPFDRIKSEYYWRLKRAETYAAPEDWIDEVFRECEKNPSCFDNHIRPQSDFLPKFDKLKIFKLEENGINSALRVVQAGEPTFVRRMIQWPSNSHRRNSSIKDVEIEMKFCNVRSKIEDFYAKDYERLEYER